MEIVIMYSMHVNVIKNGKNGLDNLEYGSCVSQTMMCERIYTAFWMQLTRQFATRKFKRQIGQTTPLSR